MDRASEMVATLTFPNSDLTTTTTFTSICQSNPLKRSSLNRERKAYKTKRAETSHPCQISFKGPALRWPTWKTSTQRSALTIKAYKMKSALSQPYNSTTTGSFRSSESLLVPSPCSRRRTLKLWEGNLESKLRTIALKPTRGLILYPAYLLPFRLKTKK